MGDMKYCALKRTLKSMCIWVGLPALAIIILSYLMICQPALLFVLIILALIIICIGSVIYLCYDMIKTTYKQHLRDCMDEHRARKEKEARRTIVNGGK